MVPSGWFIAISYLLSAAAQTADLNAPINTRPTIGSEIKRGHDVAFDCSIKFADDVISLSECVNDALSVNRQRQVDTLPFELGAFLQECQQEAFLIKAETELAPTNSLAARELPEVRRHLALCYPILRNDQKKLKITDEQLIKAIDTLAPAGRVTYLDQLHEWEKNPPKASD